MSPTPGVGVSTGEVIGVLTVIGLVWAGFKFFVNAGRTLGKYEERFEQMSAELNEERQHREALERELVQVKLDLASRAARN